MEFFGSIVCCCAGVMCCLAGSLILEQVEENRKQCIDEKEI